MYQVIFFSYSRHNVLSFKNLKPQTLFFHLPECHLHVQPAGHSPPGALWRGGHGWRHTGERPTRNMYLKNKSAFENRLKYQIMYLFFVHGQGELVPQIPVEDDQAPGESEPPEEVMERLAHLEQLVVQLKGLILDKDTQLTQKDTELANKDAQFKAGGRPQVLGCRAQLDWPVTTELCSLSLLSSLSSVCRARRRSSTLASPNSSCRPRPRWPLSTSRSASSKGKEEQP